VEGSDADSAAPEPAPVGPETGAAPSPPRSIADRPWLWALVGGLIAATAVGVAVLIGVVFYMLRPGPETTAGPPEPLDADTAAVVSPPAPEPEVEAPKPAPAPSATARARPAAPKSAATKAPATAGVREGQLVEMGPGVTPPRRVTGTPAPYPALARRVRLTGTVTVSMIVSEHGEPLEPTIEESGGPILDKAVLDAVKGWHFEPARKNGVRVRVRWTVRQKFTHSK
jgi:protein TonB